jgi:hypothetical protein
MTPTATTAWALIALANGHFTITSDLSKDSCMNLARAQYGQRAICYEYLPGGPGVTMFIDVGSSKGTLIIRTFDPEAANRRELHGRVIKDDVPWICASLPPPRDPCGVS